MSCSVAGTSTRKIRIAARCGWDNAGTRQSILETCMCMMTYRYHPASPGTAEDEVEKRISSLADELEIWF